MNPKTVHDEEHRRFEIQTGGYTAYLTYVIRGKILDIIHTFVPKELRGRGIAALLVEAAIPYARTWLNENR